MTDNEDNSGARGGETPEAGVDPSRSPNHGLHSPPRREDPGEEARWCAMLPDATHYKLRSIKDAWRFLDEVYTVLGGETRTYQDLVDIMLDYNSGRLNSLQVCVRGTAALNGHPPALTQLLGKYVTYHVHMMDRDAWTLFRHNTRYGRGGGGGVGRGGGGGGGGYAGEEQEDS